MKLHEGLHGTGNHDSGYEDRTVLLQYKVRSAKVRTTRNYDPADTFVSS
jgi:hypothetical protein